MASDAFTRASPLYRRAMSMPHRSGVAFTVCDRPVPWASALRMVGAFIMGAAGMVAAVIFLGAMT